jgi:hypothetical protein
MPSPRVHSSEPRNGQNFEELAAAEKQDKFDKNDKKKKQKKKQPEPNAV